MKQRHIPVLQQEVLAVLHPTAGEVYVDLTAGLGGHAALVLDELGETGLAYLIDQDRVAIGELNQKFSQDLRVHIDQTNFTKFNWASIPAPDMILADLGVSSMQLDDAARGFSFQHTAPLDMRMNQTRGWTVAELIADISEPDLADLLWRYGEERRARQIARSVIVERNKRPLKTTTQLAELVRAQFPKGYYRIDPATRTFQALRIAVNLELEALEEMLEAAFEALAPGGRLAIISFHSLEDRIVKQKMRDISSEVCDTITGQVLQESQFRLVTKRPITPADNEIAYNPRARSAKLRAVEKKK